MKKLTLTLTISTAILIGAGKAYAFDGFGPTNEVFPTPVAVTDCHLFNMKQEPCASRIAASKAKDLAKRKAAKAARIARRAAKAGN